ncbi:hypothetical protein MRX96_020244 [Rhipicephalus microplus]
MGGPPAGGQLYARKSSDSTAGKGSGAEFVVVFGLRRRVAANQEPSSGSTGYSLVSAASISADSMVETGEFMPKQCGSGTDQMSLQRARHSHERGQAPKFAAASVWCHGDGDVSTLLGHQKVVETSTFTFRNTLNSLGCESPHREGNVVLFNESVVVKDP